MSRTEPADAPRRAWYDPVETTTDEASVRCRKVRSRTLMELCRRTGYQCGLKARSEFGLGFLMVCVGRPAGGPSRGGLRMEIPRSSLQSLRAVDEYGFL